MFTSKRCKSNADCCSPSERTTMIYVGIDVASEKHDICIMNGEGEIFKTIFTIKNCKTEYKKLLCTINDAKKFWNDSKVSIGIESTGVYSAVLVNYLSEIEDLDIIYINPILTNMFQHSERVHYAKTDATDAKGICMFLNSKNKRLLTYTKPLYHILEIKELSRETKRVSKQINKIANRLRGLLQRIFPELLNQLEDICSDSCLNFLIKYPTPSFIKNKRNFNDIYALTNGKRINLDPLIKLSKETIGTNTEIDKIIVKGLATELKNLCDLKREYVAKLKYFASLYCVNLLSIPGIGPINSCLILGEIGNINNFPNFDSLLAYAGLNPKVYESGKYKASGLSMSKKGSAYLRNAIISSSEIIVQNDEKFRAYFEKKISEGKKYKVAIGHVAKKLTRIIYYILKNNQPYKL